MSYTQQQVSDHINSLLVELFEISEDKLVPEALLHEDLDIDSIDTVDLLIELKKFVPQEIDAERFIDAKTLGDVVEIVHQFSGE